MSGCSPPMGLNMLYGQLQQVVQMWHVTHIILSSSYDDEEECKQIMDVKFPSGDDNSTSDEDYAFTDIITGTQSHGMTLTQKLILINFKFRQRAEAQCPNKATCNVWQRKMTSEAA